MKVVHLSTSDSGGAGKAALRLHNGLNSIGVSSGMFVLSKQSQDPTVTPLPPGTQPSPIWQEQWTRWQQLLTGYPQHAPDIELFSDTISSARLSGLREIEEADIIHLHWIDGLLDYPHATEVFQGKPVVWTLHDMNAFTGGCHYALSCERYSHQCGACPRLGSTEEADLSRTVWTAKRDAFARMKLQPVTPSRWLGDCVRRSSLLSKHGVDVIPNGVPVDIFQPRPKHEVRKSVGLPIDSKILLFGAHYDSERKGFRFLLEAFQALTATRSDLALMFFGELNPEMSQGIQAPIFRIGPIHDENVLAAIYSAADVFVIPSVEDNLPNTVLESLACGTPVAGFSTGGIKDMVAHQQTGALAAPRDVGGLIDAIRWCLDHPQPDELRQACRDRAVRDYALEVQARAFRDLYGKILKRS